MLVCPEHRAELAGPTNNRGRNARVKGGVNRDAAEYLLDLANRLDGIKAAPALDLRLNLNMC